MAFVAGDCNGFVEWVLWIPRTDVGLTTLTKFPEGAPAPSTPLEDILAGLRDAARRDAIRQSDVPEPTCGADCKQTVSKLVDEAEIEVDVVYAFTEHFQGLDAAGNPTTLTANHYAFGKATFLKNRYRRECYPAVFGNVSFDLGELTVPVPATMLAGLSTRVLVDALAAAGTLDEVATFLPLDVGRVVPLC
jgi:hypothetical protein